MQRPQSWLALAVILSFATAAVPAFAAKRKPVDPPRDSKMIGSEEPLPEDPPPGEGGGGGGELPGDPPPPPPPAPEAFNPPLPPFIQAVNLPFYFEGCSPAPPQRSCGQIPHVYVVFSNDVARGTILYAAGVTNAGSRINFGFYDRFGQLVKTHLTQPSRSNCVVHHEPEAVTTSDLAPGYYHVFASYCSLSINNALWETSLGYPIPIVGRYVTPLRIR